jgi:DNA primase
MPIEWKAVGERLDPTAFSVMTVPELLAGRGSDPWAQINRLRQRLPSP